jgi:hypothetical protein
MIEWFKELDRVIRGEATRPDQLATGTLPISGRRLAALNLLLGVFYGLCMGFFAVFNREQPEWRQPVATMIKVPALFYLTLFVTFPSLYVFNALVGSRLSVITLARLMMATLGVTLAVLASFGPIVAFFSVTTNSYPFMLLLNVLMFALSGFLGLSFLFRAMLWLTLIDRPVVTRMTEEGDEVASPTRPHAPQAYSKVRTVFVCWMIVFGLVGAQMSWILRPFLGDPNSEFSWFRPRSSNFFESVMNTLRALFS